MFEKFASDTRRVVGYAMDEARSRGDKRLGTEHLLLGALHEPGPAGILGITLEDARQATGRLDAGALQNLGIEIEGFQRATMPGRGRKPAFSSGAKAVMGSMVQHAADQKSKEIALSSLLVSLLEREDQDPVTALFRELGVDRAAVRNRLQGS